LDTLVAEAVAAGGTSPEPSPSPDPKVRTLAGGWALQALLQLDARCPLPSPQGQDAASDSV